MKQVHSPKKHKPGQSFRRGTEVLEDPRTKRARTRSDQLREELDEAAEEIEEALKHRYE
jgi:hypothetical protein